MRKFILALAAFTFIFAGCSVMVDDFKNLKSGTPYKIVSNFESVETEDEFDPALTVTDEKYGVPGELTSVEAPAVTGFTVQEFEQVEIAEDGTSVLNLYYKRNLVNLTFEPNGGTWAATDSTEALVAPCRFGVPLENAGIFLSEADLVREDWGLAGWDPELPETVPAEEATYTAQWSQNFAKYAVEYYFENVDGEFVHDSSKDVQLKGIIDTETKAVALPDEETEGYEIVLEEGLLPQKTISADGSTVVVVQYKLKEFTVCFYGNGGKWEDSSFITKTGKIGEAIVVPEEGLLREDWEFTGKWLDAADGNPVSVDAVFSDNKDYYAQWKLVNAAYKITYSFEQTDGSYTVDETLTENLKGKIGDEVTKETPADVTGFDVAVTPAVVLQDGTAEVKVVYTRKMITVTFNAGTEGSWSGNKTKTQTGKFDTLITLPEEPAAGDWAFIGWKDIPAKFPAEDAEYTAEYSKAVVYYKVQYRFENVDGSGFTVVQTADSVKGAPEKMTAASPAGCTESTDGFTPLEVTNVQLGEDSTPDNTVVNVDFVRNTYKIKFLAGEGAWSDGSDSKEISGKFGQAVSGVPATEGDGCLLVRQDYKCSGWDKSVPATFPAQEVSLTAQWVLEYAPFSMSISYQNPDGTYGAATVKQGDRKLKIGTETDKAASDFDEPGIEYMTPVVTNVTVTENEAANIVVVKYPRKTITYTFNLNGGVFGGSSSAATRSGLYGSTFSGLEEITPTKSGWVFAGWNKTPASTFTEDSAFTAVWNSAVTVTLNGVMASDISVSKKVEGKTATVAVTVPYASDGWAFDWYVDGAKVSESSQSLTKALSKGKHSVMVVAKDGAVQFSKSVTVTVAE